MTEEEWLNNDLDERLGYARDKVSMRKRRLFAIACCHPMIEILKVKLLNDAIARAEKYADGQIQQRTLRKWFSAVMDTHDRIPAGLSHRESFAKAFVAVATTCQPNRTQHCDQVWSVMVHFLWKLDTPNPELHNLGKVLADSLFSDVFGNPFRPVTFDPAWRTSNAVGVAEAIYADRTFDNLPVLADALQDAGCEHPDILSHLRGPGPHVRGCWALDLVLGKE